MTMYPDLRPSAQEAAEALRILASARISLLPEPVEEETMTVTVMYRNNWFGGDGWTYYPKRVTISAFCPICGEHRGDPTWYHFCEDGEWFDVQKWSNPCNHLDTYHAVLVEASEREKEGNRL